MLVPNTSLLTVTNVAFAGGGAAITAAAVSRVQAAASLLNGTRGWAAARLVPTWNGPDKAGAFPWLFDWNNGTTSNRVLLYYNGPLQQWSIQRDGSGGATGIGQAHVPVAGTPVTVIGAWTATQIAVSVAGAAFTTWPNTHLPAGLLALFDIGSAQGAAGWIDATVLWAACGSGTLTNADAAAIQAAGSDERALAAAIPVAAALTAIWPADDTTLWVPGDLPGGLAGALSVAPAYAGRLTVTAAGQMQEVGA